MAGVLVTNNAWGTLNNEVTQFATEFYLTPGQGDRFPTAVEGTSWFYATLVDQEKNIEIVKATNRNGETIKVVRGVDGTQARAWPTDTRFELRPCAAVLNDKVNEADFDEEVTNIRNEFTNADSVLQENLKQELNTRVTKIEENYAQTADVDKKLQELEDKVVSKDQAEKDYLPLTGGEINGNLRVVSKTNGGITTQGGNVTIKKAAEDGSFYGGGLTAEADIRASGTVYGTVLQATSDMRAMKNIVYFKDGEGLDLVEQTFPAWFEWKASGEESVGVIAQDILPIVPEVVKDAGELLSVNYGGLVAVCLAAIKDLKREIEELKKCQTVR